MTDTHPGLKLFGAMVGVWLLLRAWENHRDGVATIKPLQSSGYRYRAPRADKPIRYWLIIGLKTCFGLWLVALGLTVIAEP